MPAALRFLAALLACALPACATVLEPARPLSAEDSGGTRLELLQLRRAPFDGPRGGELRVRFRLREVPPGARYVGARLSAPEEDGCAGGQLARAVHVVRGSLRPLSRELEATLTFDFRDSATARGPSNLQLSLEGAGGATRCLSAPVTLPAPQRDWRQAPQLTLGMGARGELRPGAGAGEASALLTAPLTVGLWLGPLHPELELGLPIGRCHHCAMPTNGLSDSGIPLHLRAGIDGWLWARGQLALGLSLGYRLTSVWSPTDDGARYGWLHGPELRPALALMPPAPFNPVRGRSGAGPHFSLQAPVGYTLQHGGSGALTFGLGLQFSGTL